MLSLRAYRNGDAQQIAPWLKNEEEFIWWSAGKLGNYPLAPEKLDALYAPGVAAGEWFPRTMEEDGRVCGQLLMRWEEKDAGWMHLGFIVVDPSARGKGLGSAMLTMATEYAFHMKRAQRITLHVFPDNLPAIRCYERLGFKKESEQVIVVCGETATVYRYEMRRK